MQKSNFFMFMAAFKVFSPFYITVHLRIYANNHYSFLMYLLAFAFFPHNRKKDMYANLGALKNCKKQAKNAQQKRST